MQEFHLGPQPNEKPSKADINIIEKLLGPKAAAKYKGTGEEDESRKDLGYTPSVEDFSDVEALRKEQKEKEVKEKQEQEKNIAESKRQMLVWAKKSEVDESYIAENVIYEPNGDVIWEGDCNFLWKKNMTSFPPNLKEVRGKLYISGTGIESLVGCPSSVTILDCSGTKIKNLAGCPSSVTDLDCSLTKIESLAGCPSSVTKLYCLVCEKLTEISVGLHTDLVIHLSESQEELAAEAKAKGYTVVLK